MIFKVLSNLKHNGDLMETGHFFEGKLEEFAHLVTDKVLRAFHDVKSVEEAKKIVGDEEAKEKEALENAPVIVDTWKPSEGDNTWGPKTLDTKSEEDVTPEEEKVEEVPLGQVGKGDVPPENGDNL